jgi:hypothetical protein
MECDICFEDKILKDDMTFFKCKHHICKDCYNNLKKRICPFCRRKIKILSTKQVIDKPEHVIEENTDFEDEEEYFDYEDYFNVPRIRRNRQECKRRSKEKKNYKLQKMLLNDNINNNKYLKIIPNFKRKMQKKIRLFLNDLKY